MLLQENTEPLTHTTFTVNANTAYTTVKSVDLISNDGSITVNANTAYKTVKSVDLISNGGSITVSADKEITKPAD